MCKSTSFDGITNEHILFGGPNLAMHISLLFNALSHTFVPEDFCCGIVIPLLKNKHADVTCLGITLLPIIS